MKQIKFYLLGSVALVAVFFVEHVVAMSITVQPAVLQLSLVPTQAPKDDDQEETEQGNECEELYPLCEAHLT